MKTILLQITILISFCILSYCSYAAEKPINIRNVDSSVVTHIGEERLAIIFNAKKTESYRIDWTKDPTGKPKRMIGEYPVIEQGADMTGEQSEVIKKLIASPTSYGFGWTKRTLLRPSYVLRFIQDAEQVDIFIDTNSLQWGFFYKDKSSEQNISKDALPVLSKLLNALFKK